MQQYTVTGMSCSACSAKVEKAVSKVSGVTSCSVSLLTNSMGVEGTASSADIIKAIVDVGYGATLKGKEDNSTKGTVIHTEDALQDRETPLLKKRLLASFAFLILLMYFSMGHMMWNWPLPTFFEGNHIAMGLVQLLLAVIVMVINQKFFINGFKGLIHKAPNMDTLVAMGSLASFIYSTYALFLMTDAQVKGDMETVMEYMHEFYFESAAMILALITLGKMLEARSKGKTTDALKSLMKLAPKTAVIIKNNEEITVPIEQVKKGDIFVIRPGETVAVDGRIVDGMSAVNESTLTGESVPVDKVEGDLVSAGTINQSGFLKCEATRVGEDTTLAQIIQMVSDAVMTKAPIAKVADKVSGIFVPFVIGIAVMTLFGWLLVGESFGFAIARGISVLVISCPCALGLATPVAIMVGNGMGAKHGILFKTAVSLEEAGKIEIVALDKTGTITLGEPKVTNIIPNDGISEEELLTLAFSLEQKSEHPLAKAILQKGKEENVKPFEVAQFKALSGSGLTAVWNGTTLYGGNYKFINEIATISTKMKMISEQFSEEGKTPLFFAQDGMVIGMIVVADVMKEDSPKAIKQLQNMGIHVVMLTGDNEKTANAIGKLAGVDEVIAGVLPDGKESVIRALKEKGKVAMVGDGINDAPALARADIGIAIGAGADVAIDTADVVLMKSQLIDVPAVIRLSRATLKNIHENLFWAFFYNLIGIPLAAGLFIPILGWKLNPMFGAAAMSLSSFCVVSNALRLNFFKLYDTTKDKKRKTNQNKEKNQQNQTKECRQTQQNGSTMKEVELKTMELKENKELLENKAIQNSIINKKGNKTMKKTMRIEGMMCGRCEAHVKKALESVTGVAQVEVSHVEGTAIVTLSEEVSDSVLKEVVEAQDYNVLSVE